MLWALFLGALAAWMALVAAGVMFDGAVHVLLIAAVLLLARRIQLAARAAS